VPAQKKSGAEGLWDGDNEMSNNGALTLPQLKIILTEIRCFIFSGPQKCVRVWGRV
jgi:hypothetical protein